DRRERRGGRWHRLRAASGRRARVRGNRVLAREAFWGRGIATEALVAITAHAIQTHGLTRIYAVPFAWNAASCRVLEKAAYVLEGRLRKSAIKDGTLTDQLQYAYIAPQKCEV